LPPNELSLAAKVFFARQALGQPFSPDELFSFARFSFLLPIELSSTAKAFFGWQA